MGGILCIAETIEYSAIFGQFSWKSSRKYTNLIHFSWIKSRYFFIAASFTSLFAASISKSDMHLESCNLNHYHVSLGTRMIVFWYESLEVFAVSDKTVFLAGSSGIPVSRLVPLYPCSRLRYSDRGLIPCRLCRQKSDSRGTVVGLSGRSQKGAYSGSKLLSSRESPSYRTANPCRNLNGCQSFPVLGLVARRKVSALIP